VAVAITEFPWVFVLATLIFLISCYWAEKYKLLNLFVGSLAFAIYCIPIVWAAVIDTSHDKKTVKFFPYTQTAGMMQQPFSFGAMFSGLDYEERRPDTFVYKQIKDRDLKIDFYAARSTVKAPCIVIVHGGSWSAGDSKQLPELNSYLACKGYHVAAINYRLAPAFKSPAPVEDTKDAINYLKANAERLKIDTSNFVLMGRSAGGQIALVAAYTFNDPCIRGVVSYYAPADMVWGGQVKTNKLVLNTEKVFADYLGGNFKTVPGKYYESSACEFVDVNSPPTLIIHGKIDAMVSFHHAEHLQRKLDLAGVKNYLLDLPFSTHGCDYSLKGPSGQISTYTVERFIKSVTSR
jgi:acetyl esterase/lipase